MSSLYDELERNEAAKRSASATPTLCLACGNAKLPHVVTPGCLSCQVLARDWDYGREATGTVGLGQATAELNAGLAEASGTRIEPGPLPINARTLRDPVQLDKFNPKDWPELKEHWRRERLAGLNRVPVTRCALAFIGGGGALAALLPSSLEWIGFTAVLFGVTFWLARGGGGSESLRYKTRTGGPLGLDGSGRRVGD
jgi:ribosomal protein L32